MRVGRPAVAPSRKPRPRWSPNAISALRIALVPVWVWVAEAANRATFEEAAGGAGQESSGGDLARMLALALLGALLLESLLAFRSSK